MDKKLRPSWFEVNAANWHKGARPSHCRWDETQGREHHILLAQIRNEDGTHQPERWVWCRTCDGDPPAKWQYREETASD